MQGTVRRPPKPVSRKRQYYSSVASGLRRAGQAAVHDGFSQEPVAITGQTPPRFRRRFGRVLPCPPVLARE